MVRGRGHADRRHGQRSARPPHSMPNPADRPWCEGPTALPGDTARARPLEHRGDAPGIAPKGEAMFTKAHTRRTAVELVLFLVLAVGGGLLFWGGSFAKNMVHDQLKDQRISFPAKGSPGFDAK